MGNAESVPVVERVTVLDSLQQYLYDNLPPDVDFIIQLQTAGLIDKDTAAKLRALARSGDRSCIRDLITHMQKFWDEATLDKFCTFLDKYGKKGRPRMVEVAAKIREELKGKQQFHPQLSNLVIATGAVAIGVAGVAFLSEGFSPSYIWDMDDPSSSGKTIELEHPGSKRSNPPSDDQQPPPKRPHSAQEVPTAPRVGMDGKIGRSLDILGVPEYKNGLIGKMPMLGEVLGIGDITVAILKRGDIDDQLLKILKRYIDEKSPTWRDFCKALKKDSSFNKIREKIEADHSNSS